MSNQFNVRVYGATGDGVTDDSAAINAAVDAAIQQGGGVIFFPVGAYVTSGIVIPDSQRISLVGEVSGVVLHSQAKTNDLDGQVAALIHKAGSTGALIAYAAGDDALRRDTGGRGQISHLLLLTAATTNKAILLHRNSRGMVLENLWVTVHEDATHCHGIEIFSSFYLILRNVAVRHGSENGRQGDGRRAHGYGVFIYNNASDETNNIAINQLILENVNTRFFRRGIAIGTAAANERPAHNLNSLVIVGGTSEYSEEYNVWIGQGVQGLTITGHHVENGGQAIGINADEGGGYYIGEGALNVAVTGCKLHNNSELSAETAADICIGSAETGASGVIIENNYFSHVKGNAIRVFGHDKVRHLLIANNNFAARKPLSAQQLRKLSQRKGKRFTQRQIATMTRAPDQLANSIVIHEHGTSPIDVVVQDNGYDVGEAFGATLVGRHQMQFPLRARAAAPASSVTVTLSDADHNRFITNTGYQEAVTIMLPKPSTIKQPSFRFRAAVLEDQPLHIVTQRGVQLIARQANGAIVQGNRGQLTATELGCYVEVEQLSPGKWMAIAMSGAWQAG